MSFSSESEFEDAVIAALRNVGWGNEPVLKYPTQEQLIQNWASILFQNNQDIDRLNKHPLTPGEMRQIQEKITQKAPWEINRFINGKRTSVKRNNPDDTAHFGKEVSLKIYDRREIAAGQSRYQIVRQPLFQTKSKIFNDRRGDLMLLINGMPVIHIELKKSGVPVSQACNQIEKYANEGVFTGLFSLVQIFVAMTPEETVYFANPGSDGKFNPNFYFHWADFNNDPVNDWKEVTKRLLSIPMAHQMIGFYTVADENDKTLKVMRSYQYYAASAIADKVAKTKWEKDDQFGGFIWHTTGSGKTMTSFKSAQLIASSKDADKVIFLVDRIELGTQSVAEYRGFADESEKAQETENTGVLVAKLKSAESSDTLIVTSIQKMSRINDENDGGLKASDIVRMKSKKIVFIVDECHRSTFGDMLITIKRTFPKAIFFGFTGTPIQDKNQKKFNTTATVFGSELHRYSIADGIRDKNVLGFDPYKILTYEDKDLRTAVALEKAKAATVTEAIADPKKNKIFYQYMKLPMAGNYDKAGKYIKGIEDYLPRGQYETLEHKKLVVQDIRKQWQVLSHAGKFHAIFATPSIADAIEYYHLLKAEAPDLKLTALFDPNIDNNRCGLPKEAGLVEIIQDYNQRYEQNFTIPTFAKMKKDISSRLAHKRPYEQIETTPEKTIDLLIVVDQMLTGFDSKWINTLYLDKFLQYENIIQAFSRTNRLFGPEKPFGTIRYYLRPHTMERNIEEAVSLYSGERPLGLFVDRLNKNLENLNHLHWQIKDLFEQAGINDFIQLPADTVERKKFAILFKSLNEYLEAAKVQGFRWDKLDYENQDETKGEIYRIKVEIDEKTYRTLALRYKELFIPEAGSGKGGELPYEIDGHLTAIDTKDIDADYMNNRFEKYRKLLGQTGTNAATLKRAEEELHKTFATLSQEEQKYANLFLHDMQRGDVSPTPEKTLQDYITEYISRAKNDQIHRFATLFGLDEKQLRNLIGSSETNINEFGRYDALKRTVDLQKAQEYFEAIEGGEIAPRWIRQKVDKLLRTFITSGGFNVPMPNRK